ncbi:hypothetical protein MTBBW1_2330002 [Desulfamplus magnetovallimortis]|uniref:Uncharacterized protein n=1 Tax=Desulfamplus magnetovallimortis TaxID=1246637 RepID=A0A1W1HDZ2_9BACT|nr:hypothetical protein MTBBW1_2330002 [Desulfamplus magnetovallimortis]
MIIPHYSLTVATFFSESHPPRIAFSRRVTGQIQCEKLYSSADKNIHSFERSMSMLKKIYFLLKVILLEFLFQGG